MKQRDRDKALRALRTCWKVYRHSSCPRAKAKILRAICEAAETLKT